LSSVVTNSKPAASLLQFAQNIFTDWVIIKGETTVDATGNANSAPATVEIYNPNGVLVASLCVDAVGTRFEL